jgi:hypothetical protein
MARGPPNSAREIDTTVGAALEAISRGDGGDSLPSYLSAWDYVRGNSSRR